MFGKYTLRALWAPGTKQTPLQVGRLLSHNNTEHRTNTETREFYFFENDKAKSGRDRKSLEMSTIYCDKSSRR